MSFSYNEFPNDVLEAFSILITKHRLSKKIEGNYYVELSNKNMVLQFEFDRGTLYCEIKKKGDDYKFAIWQVYNFLFSQNQKKFGNKMSTVDTLNFYCDLLNNDMESIILGDFGWYNELKKHIEYEKSLIAIILGPHMEHPNPISQKFWNGDETWKSDIELFIKEKGIKLK